MQAVKHGHAQRRDAPATRTYNSWAAMHRRCRGTSAYYGGRGIRVCGRWSTFTNFLADMGEVPAGHTLDRKNVNGNYCKRNCRWVNRSVQARNRRCTKLTATKATSIRRLCAGGRTVSSIARLYKISRKMVREIRDGDQWQT